MRSGSVLMVVLKTGELLWLVTGVELGGSRGSCVEIGLVRSVLPVKNVFWVVPKPGGPL